MFGSKDNKYQKAYEETMKMATEKKNNVAFAERGASVSMGEVLQIILDQILEIVAKTDANGEVVRNENGSTKINWWGVLWNIGKIIGKISALGQIVREN